MLTRHSSLILGAGVTGLAAGLASGFPIYEAERNPGGICSSYYLQPGQKERLAEPPLDGQAYRFEIGGGHWIFGGEPVVLRFIQSLSPTKRYDRRSAVYFAETGLTIPYPIQNNLGYLDEHVAARALGEMLSGGSDTDSTMEGWLRLHFGPTLSELFFGPFHNRYTVGLWKRIAPQDPYKSPIQFSQVIEGAFRRAPSAGYNVTFAYPEAGLDSLVREMARRADVQFGKRVVHIEPQQREISFSDGSTLPYETLVSTLPLNRVMDLAELEVDAVPDPSTSVLVLNIGARRGPNCPTEHWLYIPDSASGFHRVGFYSNVDPHFLPQPNPHPTVSLYVERAYLDGQQPTQTEVSAYSSQILKELEDWGFIEMPEVIDPTWIDVAYTWAWPGSTWRRLALSKLHELGILQIGRYARWTFQGIADSIRDGLYAGAAVKGTNPR